MDASSKREGLRILLVEPDLEENGAIRVSLDRAQRWAESGADVSVLFVSDYHGDSRVSVPPELRTIVANKGLRSARYMLPKALRSGWKPARSADVVVAGREIASGLLIGTLLAKLARRRLAVTVHSNVKRALAHHGTARHSRNVLACLRRADVLTPVSRGLAPGLLELGLPSDRVQVVENGFNVERLAALAAEPSAFSVPTTPFIIGVGRLAHQKGFDLLIAAHAQALREGAPHHQLLIVGDGPEKDELAHLAAELGVQDSVVFTGFLANPYPLLAKATLFALSSRWEGFSLALGEALALAVPSIAADCVSGPRELLDDGRCGDLLPVEDANALGQAIARHLRDPGRLRALAAKGQSFVNDHFTARRSAERHLAVLSHLTAQQTPAHA